MQILLQLQWVATVEVVPIIGSTFALMFLLPTRPLMNLSGTCFEALKATCLTDGHMTICPVHPDSMFVKNGACVKCMNKEVRKVKEEHDQKEVARKAEAKNTDDMFLKEGAKPKKPKKNKINACIHNHLKRFGKRAIATSRE